MLIYTRVRLRGLPRRIESIHPSQEAAARSLGLRRWQTLRHVILPQAVRRVIPPLLNDFIGAAEGHRARRHVLGAIEAFQQSYDRRERDFNYTRVPHRAALLFVAITIPLARFTDWLIARATGAAARREGVA